MAARGELQHAENAQAIEHETLAVSPRARRREHSWAPSAALGAWLWVHSSLHEMSS